LSKTSKQKNILKFFDLTDIFKNYDSHIVKLINNELFERTMPDKSRSPKQKYRTSEKGKKLLEVISI